MDPVTGLHHGTQTGWMKEVCVCGWLGSESITVTLIRQHLVAITPANTTQAGWHIRSLQSNLRFGHGRAEAACGIWEEDEAVLVLMHFWTLVSAKWHAVLLFDVSENTLFQKKRREEDDCVSPGVMLFSPAASLAWDWCSVGSQSLRRHNVDRVCLLALIFCEASVEAASSVFPPKKKKKAALRLVQGLY